MGQFWAVDLSKIMAGRRKKYAVKGLDRHGRKWRWRKMIEGRKIEVTFEADSEQQAVAHVLALMDRPELVDAGKWDFEVEAFIADSRARGVLSKNYAQSRRNVLLRVGRDLGLDSPTGLTEARIRRWLDGVAEGGAVPKTIAGYLGDLKAFSKWLVKGRKIIADPAKGIAQPVIQASLRDVFLEREEIRALIDAAKVRGDPELELILLLAAECGMRFGEISAARADWVDVKRGTITIPAEEKDGSWSRKGRRGNLRGVTVEMVGELREWFGRHGVPSPYLLRPEKGWGKHRYRYDFRKKLGAFLSGQKIEGLWIHDLRRSFGSNRVSAGVSIEQVANWMGIDPRTAWKHYARFVPVTGAIERGSARMDEPVAPAGAPVAGVKEKLEVIKGLLDDGLITSKEWKEKREAILKEL